MTRTTVRISDASRNILRQLATQEGASMQALLDKAIEAYRRRLFLTELNKAYAALREDPEAWSQVEKDRSAWDATLNDGLEIGESATKNRNLISKEKRKQHG